MSELTNIHARAVKDLTTPTGLPADPDALDQVKLVAGNFPKEYAGNEALTFKQIKDLATSDLESKVEIALSNLSTTANKYYPTLSEANSHLTTMPVNTVVTIGEEANKGLWYKATAEATTLTRSAYDPLTQAKNYTNNKAIATKTEAVATANNYTDLVFDTVPAAIAPYVAQAEAAATAAAISAGVFETPEAGVDPVTGVADGAYFNVRSSNDESYVDEYQNMSGVATPTGKSYPSAAVLQDVRLDVEILMVRAGERSLLEFIPPQYHQSIQNYEYTVDCCAYIQTAIDWATLNNKGLYAPAGGYLIGGDSTIFLVNNWGADKNLIVRGAGLGLTVFKEAPGKTNRAGRYCKMFYLYYGSTSFVGDFGHIKFSGITFDKNGSSNINDSHLYNYEQAHILSGAGSGTVNIKSIQFDDIELRDKVGGGINFSSSQNVKIGKITCNNIISEYHPKVTGTGDGTFGQRGCLEFGTPIEVLDINNPKVIYAQIEPVVASSVTNQRTCNITGGAIKTVEWTDTGGYSFANIVNCDVKRKFLTRGVHVNATNCRLKVPEVFSGGIIKINGGTLLLNYNPDTNQVTPCLHGYVSGGTAYSEMWLSDLDIRIDNDDPALLPTGYGVSAPTSGMIGSYKRILNNVKLDPRLEYGVNAYGNGDWKIVNSDIQGRVIQVSVGGVGEVRGGSVELINNNYLGAGTKVHIYRNNALWELKVYGTYPFTGFWGSTGFIDIDGLIKVFPVLTSTSQLSNNVFSFKGQPILNPNFSGVGVQYWIKSATGNASFDRVVYNIFGTLAYAGETIAAGARGVEQTITVTGAVLGDAVQVTLDKNLSGCVIEWYVSAANTVKARIYNPTAASVTLAAGTLKAKLI